jgi:hypothetical protein
LWLSRTRSGIAAVYSRRLQILRRAIFSESQFT